MRVLFDYSAFVMQSHGGVSRVLFEVFQHLLKRDDVECYLFAGFHKNRYLRDAPHDVKKSIIGWYLPSKIVKQRVFMPLNRILFQIFAKINHPDICHYTYFDTPSVPGGCKVVVTVHDMIHELYPEMFSVDDPQRTWKRNAIKCADGVVCVSENTLKDLKNFIDLKNKKTAVIYHGNSLSEIKPELIQIEKPYFLYIGNRTVEYKNFDLVVEAFAEKQHDASLICFGGGKLSQKEKNKIKKYGLAERITQIDGNDELLAAYYKNANALIYPSIYEGFGLPPVEAMGLGCPVIVSSAPPIPEVVETAGLYFNPYKSSELSYCIEKMLNRSIIEEWSDKGIKQSQKFQWSNSAYRLLTFYNQLLMDNKS